MMERYFKPIISHIIAYKAVYSLLSSVMMAVLTGVYVILTFHILNESKKTREQQSRPLLFVDIKVKYYSLFLKIKNAGNEPAKMFQLT